MDLELLTRFVVAFVVVLALILLTAWLFRRFAGGRALGQGWHRGRDHRIEVVDATAVDAKRRLVLVRRDSVEHLVLIGGSNDVVVETGIAPPPGVLARRAEAHKTEPHRTEAPKEPVRPAPAEAHPPRDLRHPEPKPAEPRAPEPKPTTLERRPLIPEATRPAPRPTPAPAATAAPARPFTAAPKPAEKPAAEADDDMPGMKDMAKRLEAALKPLNTLKGRPGAETPADPPAGGGDPAKK